MIRSEAFDRSILDQIALNQSRTPSQRFLALCDLLDTVVAMMPQSPEARERRRRALAARQQDRERFREFCRRNLAAGRAVPPEGV